MTPQRAVLGQGAVTREALDAIQFFMSRGWSPIAAMGIVGGLQQESGARLNPTIWGDNGASYGVAQWNKPGGRYHLFFRWADQNGLDPHDRQTQLAFVDHELKTSHGRAGQKIAAAAERGDWAGMGLAMGRDYEGASIEAANARQNNAMALANAWRSGLAGPVNLNRPGANVSEYATLPSLQQPPAPIPGMGGPDYRLNPVGDAPDSFDEILAGLLRRADENQGQGPTIQALGLTQPDLSGPMPGAVPAPMGAPAEPGPDFGGILNALVKGMQSQPAPRLQVADSAPFDADAFAAQSAAKLFGMKDHLMPVEEQVSTSPQPLQMGKLTQPGPFEASLRPPGPFQSLSKPKTAPLGGGMRLRAG